LLRSGLESGDSAEDHGGEDQGACSDEGDGYGEGKWGGRPRNGGGDGLCTKLIAGGAKGGGVRIGDVAIEFVATVGAALEGHETKMVTGFSD
jgi:hypothetical protein